MNTTRFENRYAVTPEWATLRAELDNPGYTVTQIRQIPERYWNGPRIGSQTPGTHLYRITLDPTTTWFCAHCDTPTDPDPEWVFRNLPVCSDECLWHLEMEAQAELQERP
jgi:hypothetical protein